MTRIIRIAMLASLLACTACASKEARPPVPFESARVAQPTPSARPASKETALAPGPRVHLPQPVVDLGKHLDTKLLTFDVVIENVGDEVLELAYFEPGVSFGDNKILVEPGEAYSATAMVDLSYRPGGPNEGTLHWRTNDPENRLATITVRYHVRPVVDVVITPLEPGG